MGEDLLPTDSSRGGGEDGNLLSEGVANPEGGKESEDDEVPPWMERTRCNKAAEDEYLEDITQRREQVAWPNKKRNYGGKSMKTDQYKGQEANSVQEYLMGEWQKTRDQSMKGEAKVFGENDEGTSEVNSTIREAMATNEFHKFPMKEPTADKNKSSKEQTMKYRLIITDDDQEEFKMTVIEYNEDIMHLVWSGGITDLENIRHHASQCVTWIAVTNPSRKNRRSSKRNLSWQRTNNPETGCLRHDYSLNQE